MKQLTVQSNATDGQTVRNDVKASLIYGLNMKDSPLSHPHGEQEVQVNHADITHQSLDRYVCNM